MRVEFGSSMKAAWDAISFRPECRCQSECVLILFQPEHPKREMWSAVQSLKYICKRETIKPSPHAKEPSVHLIINVNINVNPNSD
ncbi:hypothetical protein UY3_08993 [Chelonia mydas]|uniref:Uncharacterized protein n=1 Tax=Chelonia mydas TaxID=8469 RepID=M7BDN1_CHEMY|nr:hypothetical protein UY3_08993 [Chelonia mydas]